MSFLKCVFHCLVTFLKRSPHVIQFFISIHLNIFPLVFRKKRLLTEWPVLLFDTETWDIFNELKGAQALDIRR
jgi:hypothetical protein